MFMEMRWQPKVMPRTLRWFARGMDVLATSMELRLKSNCSPDLTRFTTLPSELLGWLWAKEGYKEGYKSPTSSQQNDHNDF